MQLFQKLTVPLLHVRRGLKKTSEGASMEHNVLWDVRSYSEGPSGLTLFRGGSWGEGGVHVKVLNTLGARLVGGTRLGHAWGFHLVSTKQGHNLHNNR